VNAAAPFADPWRFEANPEVYLLVGFLVVAYVYLGRVVGPKAVAPGQPVFSRRNIVCFVAAITLLFVASTWPLHQIAEGYLYSAHMLQHMMLSYFMPPLVLLATPEWLLRVLVGKGSVYRVVQFFTKPVVAAVLFNGMVMITHIPCVVNESTTNGGLHYLLHFALVLTAVLMWMPVVGPFRELQMKPAGKMIYLFLQSVVPTVPAAWLALAEGTVYDAYDQPVRVWGIDAIADQQIAGLFMKVGGGIFLWTIVIVMFTKRLSRDSATDDAMRRPDAELTFEQVAEVFDRASAPAEPRV
jgi:putative membrane protein